MLLFNVGGYILDTGTGVSLSLTRKNNAFTFGDLELTRSVSFKVPATANNDKIFALAKDYHYTGAKARVNIPAQMQYDGGAADGYIYISQCSGKEYECVFVFGDLVALKTIMQTKLKEYLTDYTDYVATNAPTYSNAILNMMPYKRLRDMAYLADYYNPVMNIKALLRKVLTEAGYSLATDYGENLGIVFKEIADAAEREVSMMIRQRETRPDTRYIAITQPANHNLIKVYDGTRSNTFNDSGTVTVLDTQYFALDGYDSIEITFPDDFPDDYFLVDWVANNRNIAVTFYGDYSFDTDWHDDTQARAVTGKPLAGRTVTVEKTNGVSPVLMIVDKNYFYNNNITSFTDYKIGFSIDAIPEDTFDIVVTGKVNYNNANRVFLYDCIGSMTVTDLLKKVAVTTGRYIYINGTTIGLRRYSGFDNKKLEKVVKCDQLERTFKDWKRNNYIIFSSEDYVLEADRLSVGYYISSALLETEADIYTFSESEGENGGADDYVYIQDFQWDATEAEAENEADKDTLAVTVSSGYLKSLRSVSSYIKAETNLQTLCTQSTKIRVQCVMPLVTFNAMQEGWHFLYDGVRWAWTEAQWSKGKATLTLQKYA